MWLKILGLIKGKTLPILILISSIGSAAVSAYVTNFIWDAKYTKLELTVERDKSQAIAALLEKQNAAYAEVINKYNQSVGEITQIIVARDAEVEESTEKYRNLYAAYTRLQRNAPTQASCFVDADRSDLLMQSVQQANEARTRFAADRTKKTPASG
jgi:hypothetical protein